MKIIVAILSIIPLTLSYGLVAQGPQARVKLVQEQSENKQQSKNENLKCKYGKTCFIYTLKCKKAENPEVSYDCIEEGPIKGFCDPEGTCKELGEQCTYETIISKLLHSPKKIGIVQQDPNTGNLYCSDVEQVSSAHKLDKHKDGL